MQQDNKEWALVTGSSQGIGLEIARKFAQDRINLVLVARSGERLNELAEQWGREYGIEVVPLVVDLSEEGAPEEVYNSVLKQDIRITYLVNNAGVGLFGLYQETDIEREHQMITLNCLALTRLTKLFLPLMLEQRHGRILNVASVASFQPGPYQAVYFATKAYVLSYSEAIAEDLKGTGVTVTALCPGLTDSGFVKAASMESAGILKLSHLASSESVAAAGYKAMNKGRRLITPGFLNKLMVFSPRFSPRRLVTLVVSRMMKPSAR